ncbi:MAG: acyl-CoA carboxylase subunit beta [Planctomycetaceae bacterium]|jgi:methylmalonyl-CoA carboxyltransferase large subunit|nr:acyl-CoA carboxylase subunit beta [Planctomycetaceae bacterium]
MAASTNSTTNGKIDATPAAAPAAAPKPDAPAKPAPPPTMAERVEQLKRKRAKVELGGGADRIAKHHAAGNLTARERLAAVLDEGSFQERDGFAQHRCSWFGMAGKDLPADGVVTGVGTVDGRLVHAASQDFTVGGGALGEVHGDKIVDMMRASLKTGTPFVFINDSGGARIQEGIDSLASYGRVFYHNTLLSGVVPQISLICGPCAGGAAYSPALTDFVIQTRRAQMFITGPSVIKQVTREEVSADELGGAEAHMHYSGNIHFIAEDDRDAARICRKLLSFLPSNNMEDPPRLPHDGRTPPDDKIGAILPTDQRYTYDMHKIIERLVDNADFLEVQAAFAPNLIVGFGRVTGRTVGIVANNPAVKAGSLDIDSSDKAARFVRFCNGFNIPIVTLVDTPGYFPGVKQEYGGIIRHGAKLLFSYSAATVPKITVVIRKAYGGAYVAMASKDLGADAVAAWPTAEIAVMGAEAAAEVIFRKELGEAENRDAKKKELVEQYRATFSNPFMAAGRRMVDNIIDPADTRRYIACALEQWKTKRELRPEKKHGLMPL